MDTRNPYAPPQADLGDATSTSDRPPVAPALWNPNAAAYWSLLLSPAFGAFLHMKNWQALGEPEKAAASRKWFIGVIAALFCLVLVAVLLPDSKGVDAATRGAGIGMLMAWYITSARPQAALVLGCYGKSYPRRGWLLPLSLAVAAAFGFFVAAVIAGLILGAMGFAA